jgi:hypothetical protein
VTILAQIKKRKGKMLNEPKPESESEYKYSDLDSKKSHRAPDLKSGYSGQ